MTTNSFKTVTSTVVTFTPSNLRSEIWVRYEHGGEASYQVPDPSFRAREGHPLTAILYGSHPVALRNDSTRMKIQLLSGEDLLGRAHADTRSANFWGGWLVVIFCPGWIIAGLPMSWADQYPHNPLILWSGNILGVLIYLWLLLGIPYVYMILPRIRRARHQRRIKDADAVIAELFSKL